MVKPCDNSQHARNIVVHDSSQASKIAGRFGAGEACVPVMFSQSRDRSLAIGYNP